MLTGDDIAAFEEDQFEEKYNRVLKRVRDEIGNGDFSFTPGDQFMEANEDDMVTAILSSIKRLEAGELERINHDG